MNSCCSIKVCRIYIIKLRKVSLEVVIILNLLCGWWNAVGATCFMSISKNIVTQFFQTTRHLFSQYTAYAFYFACSTFSTFLDLQIHQNKVLTSDRFTQRCRVDAVYLSELDILLCLIWFNRIVSGKYWMAQGKQTTQNTS